MQSASKTEDCYDTCDFLPKVHMLFFKSGHDQQEPCLYLYRRDQYLTRSQYTSRCQQGMWLERKMCTLRATSCLGL